jgi:hypothetical protein
VTHCPAVTLNDKAQSFTATITTAPKKTKVYYRMVFAESVGGKVLTGKIESFTTEN